ncbi:MAG: SDR family oxidoreductase [Chitinophagia bacterium]|nr:SDR family oxidoreductase [Chitinophagia bacterium]
MEGFASRVSSQIPLRRFGQYREIANKALFLASTDSYFITGVEIPLDSDIPQV